VIVNARHPRTGADRVLSVPIDKKEYRMYLMYLRTGKGMVPTALTPDQQSFIKTGLMLNED